MPKEPKDITSLSEALKRVDYASFFSDTVAIGYMEKFPKRLSQARIESGKQALFSEAHNALLCYSILVYHTYQNDEVFRAQIDSSQEHRRNFLLVKSWLDKHNCKALLDGLGG